MATTPEESLLEQVQALRSKIEEVMGSETEKADDYGDFMQSSDQSDTEDLERQPDPVAPESSQVQMVVDIHERHVLLQVGKAQAVGVDEHGVEGGHAADIEPPVVVSEPDSMVKQLYVTEMSPEDMTTYSTGDSPSSPKLKDQGHQ